MREGRSEAGGQAGNLVDSGQRSRRWMIRSRSERRLWAGRERAEAGERQKQLSEDFLCQDTCLWPRWVFFPLSS